MLKPIKTKKDYEAALERCYTLMQKDLKPGSAFSNELEILSILVEEYEKKHFPIPAPHPIDAIKYRLEQSGLDEKELKKFSGDAAANQKY